MQDNELTAFDTELERRYFEESARWTTENMIRANEMQKKYFEMRDNLKAALSNTMKVMSIEIWQYDNDRLTAGYTLRVNEPETKDPNEQLENLDLMFAEALNSMISQSVYRGGKAGTLILDLPIKRVQVNYANGYMEIKNVEFTEEARKNVMAYLAAAYDAYKERTNDMENKTLVDVFKNIYGKDGVNIVGDSGCSNCKCDKPQDNIPTVSTAGKCECKNESKNDPPVYHKCPVRNLMDGVPFRCPMTVEKPEAPAINVDKFMTLVEATIIYVQYTGSPCVVVTYPNGRTSSAGLDDYQCACLVKWLYENMRRVSSNAKELVFAPFFHECRENGVTGGKTDGLAWVLKKTSVLREPAHGRDQGKCPNKD